MAKLYSGVSRGNNDLERVLEAIKTDLNSLAVLSNNIKSTFSGKGVLTAVGLAIGSTKPRVANAAFDYMIAGVKYNKAAVSAGTALSGDDLPAGKTGAWALDIDAAGTITIAEAAGNDEGYASAALALAGLPAVATAKCRMGTVVVANATEAVFDPGTTDLDTASITATYADATTVYNSISDAVTITLT